MISKSSKALRLKSPLSLCNILGTPYIKPMSNREAMLGVGRFFLFLLGGIGSLMSLQSHFYGPTCLSDVHRSAVGT